MYLTNVKTRSAGLVNAFSNFKNRGAMLLTAVVASAASGLASAQSLGTVASAEIAATRADVLGVLTILIGIVFLLVAFAYMKRAK